MNYIKDHTIKKNQFSCFIIGQGEIAIACVQALVDAGHCITGIVAIDEMLADWAMQHGYQCYPTDELLTGMVATDFDYLFSINNPLIITTQMLTLPRRSAINYHESMSMLRKSSLHASAYTWMNGEFEHEISWHIIEEGRDTGAILKHLGFSVTANESAMSLNSKFFVAATETFVELIEELSTDSTQPRLQDLSQQATPRYPLTSSQREIWFDQILHESMPMYNVGGHFHLSGKIEPHLFEKAANLLVQKHDCLRILLTNDRDEDGLPLQTFAPSLCFNVPIKDFSHLDNALEKAMVWMQQRFNENFTLIGEPLFRYDLVKVKDTDYYWLMQYHHLIADGFTIAFLTRSLADIYSQLLNGQTPNLQSQSYLDFINYDRALLASESYEFNRRYWLTKYPASPEPLFSPRYFSRSAKTFTGSYQEEFIIAREKYQQLHQFAKQHGVTFFRLLLAVFYVYFTRTAQRDDFTIGFTTLNRNKTEFKETAGTFTLVNPGLFNFGSALSFAQLLQKIDTSILEDLSHQAFASSEINRTVSKNGAMEHSSLFDVSVSYQRFDYDTSFGGINGQATWLFNQSEQIPLLVHILDFNAQCEVKLGFVYNLKFFNAEDVKILQARLMGLFEAVAQNVEAPITALPIMTEQEQRQLQAWNATATDYPKDKTIVDLFEVQVETTPEHIALVFEGISLSYRELNTRVNQLAHYLLSLKVSDTQPLLNGNPLIAIAVERSLEMVIGLLTILKVGGAYVPIDPDYPVARIRTMLEDSQASLLLTQSHLLMPLSLAQLRHDCVVVFLDKTDVADQSAENLPLISRAEDLAYVIYTSGSTGVPKGVMIEHGNLYNSTQARQGYYRSDAKTRLLLLPSFAFDAFAGGAFLTLSNGGILYLTTHIGDIDKLATLIITSKISHLICTPSHYQEMLNQQGERLETLVCVILGGEVAPWALLQQHLTKKPQTVLFNEYGPTEATIWSTVFQYNTFKETSSIIGKPIANTRIYILNTEHQLQPSGIAGELCIAGAGLARGYLNRPELTDEKFIEVELPGKTERIYKTGDLARWLPDGNLEFLGRIDRQIKLRGFRIELGEIEQVLSQHEKVNEAVVNLYEADGNKRLVAYVTGLDETLVIDRLRDWLKARLPDYMVPSHFMVLERLPLSPNGKIDRKALPAPDVQQSTEFSQPITPTEELLATLWATLLKCEVIGRNDNFFELGGHSLLATQLIARIRESFHTELPIRLVFEHSKLASLATAIDATTTSVPADARMLISKVSHNRPIPLSFMQEQIWRFSQANNVNGIYSAPDKVSLIGALNLQALRQSFDIIFQRHESLRTHFATVNGEPVQIIDPVGTVDIDFIDLSQLSEVEQIQEIERIEHELEFLAFDLEHGPLWNLTLLRLNEESHVLFISLHHIISDARSLDILFEELSKFYSDLLRGKTILPVTPLPFQYADFACWQRQFFTPNVLNSRHHYWQQLLTKPATPLNLITDYPRCDEAGQHQFPSGNEWFQFPPELTQQLKQFSQHHEVTLFTTLLAAYVNLLHQLSGSEDLWIAAPMSKRNQASIENLIGFFSSMSLLHIQTTKGQAFTELLAHVKEVLLAALVNQDITLKQLLQASSLDWLPEIPQIRTMLNFTQRPLTEIAMQGLMARLDIKASSTMNNDLAITMWEENNSDNGTTITGYFSYRMDLFKSETILQIIKNFQQLLEANTRIFDGQLEMVHGTIKVNSDISGNAMSVCSG